MATPTVYVICDNNCKFEGMTKEQIMAAIMQAVNEGTISNIDAGFITKIKEMNAGGVLQWWVGTTAEYNELEVKDNDMLYVLDDEDIWETIERMAETLDGFVTGALQAPKATNVTSTINGVLISQILDSDGKTAKKAKVVAPDEMAVVDGEVKLTLSQNGVYCLILKDTDVLTEETYNYETDIVALPDGISYIGLTADAISLQSVGDKVTCIYNFNDHYLHIKARTGYTIEKCYKLASL